jgi:hypothetical protein
MSHHHLIMLNFTYGRIPLEAWNYQNVSIIVYVNYWNFMQAIVLLTIKSTLCKFLLASANFKKLWKHILHPVGNK